MNGIQIPSSPTITIQDLHQSIQKCKAENFGQVPEFAQLLQRSVISEVANFIDEEWQYVTKLRRLKEARSNFAAFMVPERDLKSLFGLLDSILRLHEFFIPAYLITCQKLEDVLDLFVSKSDQFKVYVYDQWMKARYKYKGEEVVLRRLDPEDAKNINLPEKRIIEYINFHEHLKASSSEVKDSELFIKSIKSLKKIVLQMQYAKDLASITSLPSSADGFVYLVDSFQVKSNTNRFTPYRIYCCSNFLYFVNPVTLSFEFELSNREISLNPMNGDDFAFEVTLVSPKKVFILKAETSTVKTAWLEALTDFLFKQAEEEKLKIINKTKTP